VNLQIVIPFIVAVVMIGVVAIASGYPYLQAKLSVLFSGTFVLVLALVQLVKELFRAQQKRLDEQGAGRKEAEHDTGVLPYVLEAAWMIGFALAIYVLGFMIAIPLYICAYMKSHGTRWSVSIMTGGGMAAFCYIIFVLILEMKLYSGIILMHLGL